MRIELTSGNRKSFYGKCYVEDEGSTKTLFSYGTKVATITYGKVELTDDWCYSATTVRHVRAFLEHYGFEVGSENEIRKLYCV